jgi:WD40 repeat protein
VAVKVYLWSMTSGKIIGTLAYQLPVNGSAALAFSPDGRTLAAAGDQGQIQLWTIR